MQKIKEIRVEEVHNIEEKEHFFRVYFDYGFMVFFFTRDERFCAQNEDRIFGTEKVVTLSKISLRSISRFSILLAQNDRPVRSFRLWGRSTSS